jgi:hypothetical protein
MKPTMQWELIDSDMVEMYRAKIVGGWLIRVVSEVGVTITFVPDRDHEWDGRSLS